MTLNKFIVIQNSAYSGGVFEFYTDNFYLYPFIIIVSALAAIGTKKLIKMPALYLSFLLMAFYNIYFIAAAIIFNFLLQLPTATKKIYLQIFSKIIIIQFLLAILQIGLGHSLGLGFLGEANLNLEIDGVSKLSLFGLEFLRGYGTFAHPNILGAYGVFFLQSFKTRFLNILSFSLNANIAQIFVTKFKFRYLLFPAIVLLIKNPFTHARTFTERIGEYTGLLEKIEYQPAHNVFMELLAANPLMLMALIYILYSLYRRNKALGLGLLILGTFDHYLISHPQGIMLWALGAMFIRNENSEGDHLESL